MPSGSRIIAGRYEVVTPLAPSGQGTAYIVRDLHQNEEVVLKLLNPASVTGPWHEAQILAGLRDPHILSVLNADHEAGVPYLVTQRARHGTVGDAIRRNGERGIAPSDAVRWLRQACEGVQRTHQSGLVHNDVKPDNLFLSQTNAVLLGDFGSASALDASGTAGPGGTPQTMAPEVAAAFVLGARPSTTRSDVFSLGATLYWMLAAEPPFQADPSHSRQQVLTSVSSALPTSLRDRAPHVSVTLAQITERAMARDPKDRFATPADLASALGRLRETQRAWVRTDECGSPHLACWRGTKKRGAPVRVCKLLAPSGRFDIEVVKLPGGRRTSGAAQAVRPSEVGTKLRRLMRGAD